VLGHRLRDLPGYDTSAFDAVWQRLLAGEELHGLEMTQKRKDGTLLETANWATTFYDEHNHFNGVLRLTADITEEKRLKEQLLQSQKMESVGRLAGGVAHDFNNLLAVISGYSQGMLRRMDGENPLRTHVSEILHAATRGAGLTRQLLAFSRRQAISPQSIELNDLVKSVHEMLRPIISARIEILISGGDCPRWIHADPSQMEQVLMNLALNARDAMEGLGSSAPLAEGPAGCLGIATATESLDAAAAAAFGVAPGTYVRLSVSDTGPGMDPETRSHIFEPFFTTKALRGTGLGLSIVYGIVEDCHGHISVASQEGEGTQFDILLPGADDKVTR
jgi:signal transduction histidine kinase